MGIFNRFMGGNNEVTGNNPQVADVLGTLKAVNREKEQAMQRLASALDAVTLPLVLADEGHVIVHANAAALKQLRATEGELRGTLTGFSSAALVGGKLESLYPPSILQRSVFDALIDSRSDTLLLGGRRITATASAVYDNQRQRLGTVLEWRDDTDSHRQAAEQAESAGAALAAGQAATERALAETDRLNKELERIAANERVFEQLMTETIDAAASGDLGQRVDTTRLHGVAATMAGSVNQLMANFEQVIDDVAGSLNALASGKLTGRITQDYQGSFGLLKGAINTTIERLVDVVSELQQSAVNVRQGAAEISNSNTNLSSRTEQQAASLEETSAAMEEITTTVQQNAANAIQANNLARGARETAENGGQVVSRAVAAMQAISESSNKINDIIGVIDEIAFQTNLLALNAAVEAARAGDQGRGFAVVADEVRNLAGRSAKAAKEIKELIKDSGEKVKEGSLLVNKSGSTLEEIVTAVKKVNDIVAEISTASDEQATGLDEINRAVTEMDSMTQQNAALVEQAATAGRSLDSQAAALESMITFFDTGVERRIASRPAAAAATSRVAAKPAPGRSVKAAPAAKVKRPEPKRSEAAQSDDEDKNWTEF